MATDIEELQLLQRGAPIDPQSQWGWCGPWLPPQLRPKRYSCSVHGMHPDWVQMFWSQRAGWTNLLCLRCIAATLASSIPGVVTVPGGDTGSASPVPPIPPGTGVNSSQVVGTNTNDNALVGIVGEYRSAQSAWVAVPNESEAVMTQLVLSAGDWDVMGMGQWRPGSLSVLYNFLIVGLITAPPAWVEGAYDSIALEAQAQGSFAGLGPLPSALNTPTVRFSLASPTTVYCQTMTIYSNGSMTGQGSIRARRVR
jgi:hypothetical protein